MMPVTLWAAVVGVIMIGYALVGIAGVIRGRRRDFESRAPLTSALFHDSHPTICGDPEPHKIDWRAMRDRKVGR